jgi:PIN domain nuclease of toxin-antitoxin system
MGNLPPMLNLDTHILIAAAEGLLTRTEERILEREEWCISAIVLWEIELLARGGKLKSDLRSPNLLRVLGQLEIVPIDINIARAIRLLDFRSDPADEIIAATSIQLRVPLITRDERILSSSVVPFIRSRG